MKITENPLHYLTDSE